MHDRYKKFLCRAASRIQNSKFKIQDFGASQGFKPVLTYSRYIHQSSWKLTHFQF
jgi:hypothetical protein